MSLCNFVFLPPKDIKGRDIIQQLEQQELMSTHSMDAPTSGILCSTSNVFSSVIIFTYRFNQQFARTTNIRKICSKETTATLPRSPISRHPCKALICK